MPRAARALAYLHSTVQQPNRAQLRTLLDAGTQETMTQHGAYPRPFIWLATQSQIRVGHRLHALRPCTDSKGVLDSVRSRSHAEHNLESTSGSFPATPEHCHADKAKHPMRSWLPGSTRQKGRTLHCADMQASLQLQPPDVCDHNKSVYCQTSSA